MLPGLADAAQVADHQHGDEPDREPDAVVVQLGKRGGQRGDARRDADRDGQRVIDQQRRAAADSPAMSRGSPSRRCTRRRRPGRRRSSGGTRRRPSREAPRSAWRSASRTASPPTPPIIRTRTISSVAYATDDSASEESTARPVTLRQPLVMREMRRDRPADEEALELGKKSFFRHYCLSSTRPAFRLSWLRIALSTRK